MKDKLKHGTFIHGIAASEHIDSSGERIIVSGVDISSLTKDGIFNYEHKSDEPSKIVGKILEAKKILKKEDCENEYHKYFWDKVKMPYIYVAGELFDHVGHGAAQDVAAMLKYDKTLDKEETKALVNFSIEGSRLSKDGSNILKCIARKVSITITPCNKMAQAEHMEKPDKDSKDINSIDISKEILSKFKKSEGVEVEMVKGELKYFTGLKNPKGKMSQPSKARSYAKITPTTGQHKAGTPAAPKRTFTSSTAPNKVKVGDKITHTPKKPKTGHQIYNDPKTWEKSEHKRVENMKVDLKKKKKKSFYTSNVRKALTASCAVGAPSSLSGGAALQRQEILKNLSEESWKIYKYKDELVKFIEEKQPNLNKNEVLAVAKTYSYLEQVKNEKKLEDL